IGEGISEQNVMGLLRVAGLFQLENLVLHLIRFVEADLSPKNCVKYYAFAHTYQHYGSEDLLQSLFNFILDNFNLIDTEDLRHLPSDAMMKLVSSDHLCAENEMQVYRAVQRWNKDLLPHVRFQLLSEKDRAEIAQDGEILQQDGASQLRRRKRPDWGVRRQREDVTGIHDKSQQTISDQEKQVIPSTTSLEFSGPLKLFSTNLPTPK
ncbi:hypothetical protein Ciccas_014254, partial [Cichlidogyrus casuarinus]